MLQWAPVRNADSGRSVAMTAVEPPSTAPLEAVVAVEKQFTALISAMPKPLPVWAVTVQAGFSVSTNATTVEPGSNPTPTTTQCVADAQETPVRAGACGKEEY